ncbi:ABC transporter substrate-binding protein [Haematomicrobium sanguinis]|uniref:ABC transporter substrate-binding protein n=1 Tax=Haematomicrobium sanguinis TaxID=479106 RepID=UPI0009496E40|nr:ABC transporter substrate-binding protein [Haematomicrobium sanguinis]
MAHGRERIARRRLLTLALALPTLAACSPRPALSQPPEPSGAFPVTIEHSLGSSTIPAPAERILTLSGADADIAVALGRLPVAMDDSANSEWMGIAEVALGQGIAPRFSNAEGINFEAIREFAPDLILALEAGLDSTSYAQLAEIAPTIARLSDHQDSLEAPLWLRNTEAAARALGYQSQLEKVKNDVDASFAALPTIYPGLAGSSLAMVISQVDVGADFLMYRGNSVQMTNLQRMGTVMAEESRALEQTGTAVEENPSVVGLSEDAAQQLRAQAVLIELDPRSTTENLGSASQIPAVVNGAFSILAGDPLRALGTPSPLAAKFACERVASEAAKAAYTGSGGSE